jgi:hypothetical protein
MKYTVHYLGTVCYVTVFRFHAVACRMLTMSTTRWRAELWLLLPRWGIGTARSAANVFVGACMFKRGTRGSDQCEGPWAAHMSNV